MVDVTFFNGKMLVESQVKTPFSYSSAFKRAADHLVINIETGNIYNPVSQLFRPVIFAFENGIRVNVWFIVSFARDTIDDDILILTENVID